LKRNSKKEKRMRREKGNAGHDAKVRVDLMFDPAGFYSGADWLGNSDDA
jgi:hypothetical protein